MPHLRHVVKDLEGSWAVVRVSTLALRALLLGLAQHHKATETRSKGGGVGQVTMARRKHQVYNFISSAFEIGSDYSDTLLHAARQLHPVRKFRWRLAVKVFCVVFEQPN